MGTTIHQLRAIVTSDIKGFLSGMGQVSRATVSLRQQWKDTANAVASAATRITAAVTGIGVYAAKSFADFEDVMVEVGAITRTLGTKDFKALGDAALEMGAKTRYTSTEAAQALKQLALAGLGVEQAITALPPTLQLAASAGISIAQAAGIAAKTMKAMGLEATQLAHVNDVLVSTFTRSNTDLVQLSEGLKHAAPLAHALGVSLEDVTAVLAKMADAGFQGEMGGTAIRNIMSRLAGAVPKAVGELSRMGITTLDTTGKMRPLLDILQDIENAGLTAGEVMKIFGQRGGPQLLALLEVGVGAIKDFSKETEKAGGVADRMMKARMASLKGQWYELTSVIDNLFIEMGGDIAPILKKLIDETEKWVVANKPEIIKTMSTALRSMIDTLRDLFKWLQDNRKELWGVAGAFANVIKWIAEFLAQRPALMAFLIALKIGGLLGINNALWQMGGLLASVISSLWRGVAAWRAWAVAATAAKAASAGIGAAGAAAGAGAAYRGAGPLAMWAAGKFGLAGSAASGAGMFAPVAGALTALAAKAAVVTAAFAVIVAKLGILESVLVSWQKKANEISNIKMQERGRQFVDDAQAKRIQDIRNVRGEREKTEGKDPGAGSTIDLLNEELEKEKKDLVDRQQRARKAAEELEQAIQANLNAENGAERTRTEALVEQKQSALLGANTGAGNVARQVENLKKAITEEASDMFNNIRDQISNKGLRTAFTQQMTALTDQFNNGALSAEQFKTAVENLTTNLKKAAEDSAGTKPFQDLAKTKRRMQEGLDDKGNPLPGGVSSGVDFKNFDKLKSTLSQLNTLDKLWAEQLAHEAETEMAIVEEMRRNQGASQAVLDAESMLNRQLIQMEGEAHRAVSAIVGDKLTAKQKEQGLQRRKDATTGYEGFEEQLSEVIDTAGGIAGGGLQNIGRDVVEKLASGVEGATKDMQAQFVKDFVALQAKGPQAFMEGIEELTLKFVEDAEKLKKNAEELAEAMKELEGPEGLDQKIKELKARGVDDPAFSELEKLKQLARENKIDSGEFNQRVGRLDTSISGGQAAREGAGESVSGVLESAKQQAEEFNKEFAQKWIAGIQKTMNEGLATFNKGLEALQKEFLETDMSTDEFNRRLKLLKDELDKTGQSALDAALKEQRLAIIRGDFSSLDPQKALQDRWFAFQMSRWNAWIDSIFQAQLQMMGFGNLMQSANQGLQQFGNGLNHLSNGMSDWFEHNFGGGGGGGAGGPDISGGLAAWNSVAGKISSLMNEIAGLTQILQLKNVTESRKMEVRNQIAAIQEQIDYLSKPPPPMFVGVSQDPFFKDPGIVGGSGASSGQSGLNGIAQGGKTKAGYNGPLVTNNFPNVNRFTSAEASKVFDAMEQEARRRGKRFLGDG